MADLVNSQWYKIGQRGLAVFGPLDLFYFMPSASWALPPHQYSIGVGIINLSEDFVTSHWWNLFWHNIVLLFKCNKPPISKVNEQSWELFRIQKEKVCVTGAALLAGAWACVGVGLCLGPPPHAHTGTIWTYGKNFPWHQFYSLNCSFLIRCKIQWRSISNHQ